MKEEVSKLHAPPLPRSFVERRLHSITGFFLVLFLFEHLLVNSQAALFIGDDGQGFIHAVNFIKTLPYLPIIEITLLGLPFVLHTYLGICYLFSSSPNSYIKSSSLPHIKSTQNSAYTWQRVTAIVLVAGLLFHVTTMRFLKKPTEVKKGSRTEYIVSLSMDEGLYTLAERIQFRLYGKNEVMHEKAECEKQSAIVKVPKETNELQYSQEEYIYKQQEQARGQEKAFVDALEKNYTSKDQIVAVTPYFGTAMLLIVRDTFKSEWMCVLYTLFVLAACFHGLNGFWTFLITWGIVQNSRMQNKARTFSYALMVGIFFLGLVSIWGTYWINLKK